MIQRPPKHPFLFPFILSSCVLGILLLAYIATVTIRLGPFYTDLKNKDLEPMLNVGKTEGQAFSFDPERGPILASSAEGVYLVPKGNPVPFSHNEGGLRKPLDSPGHFDKARRPRLLFLGDSFTYGSLVLAEDAFPHKTQTFLEGSEIINAGVPGYGLDQMVLQARKLIPEYQPDYVIVQYSPWLSRRAMSVFATDMEGIIMKPYYYKNDQHAAIAPTAFIPPQWLLPLVEKYKKTPESFLDRVRFTVTFAVPFAAHLDSQLLVFRMKQWLGISPTPTLDEATIIKSAYREIYDLTQAEKGRMLILALGVEWQFPIHDALLPVGAIGIHGWQLLADKLDPATSHEYVSQYFHWRGSPPEPVDNHPNEAAHSIIAEALARRIHIMEQWKKATENTSNSAPKKDSH